MPPINPLDAWTAGKIGCAGPVLTRSDLLDHQLRRLRETVAWAKERSPFYRRHLGAFDEATLNSLDDLRRLPLTTADDLRRNDPPLLCVSQSEISHVVTLETSGTSGPPKRLYFTPEEQAAMRDFFLAGMSVFTRPGDRVLILFPGGRAGSVGDLLAHALRGMGAEPRVAESPLDPAAAAVLLHEFRPDIVAGAPVAVLALARHGTALGQLKVRAALLSSDRAGARLRSALVAIWDCEVFDHYGMTETGLGGGVDCAAHAGYHMREAELLFEIVDPASGTPLPDGEYGEVVLTTLTRRGLPLIRYRSGDVSRIVPGRCACGSPLLRLDRIVGRLRGGVDLGGAELTMADLDEALFALPQVVDFAARHRSGSPAMLRLDIATLPGQGDATAVQAAIRTLPAIADALAMRRLRLGLEVVDDGQLRTRVGKRGIAVEDAA